MRQPDLQKSSGLVPGTSPSGAQLKYTVPAIHHIPTNTHIMDSPAIAQFLESTYPSTPVPLTSELGATIEAKARSNGARAFGLSVVPRELNILCPRAREYFRRTREASLGCPLEDLMDEEKENKAWEEASEGMKENSELMMTNRSEGPFVLGEKPSFADFFVAGSMQTARVVGGGVWERMMKHDGYKGIYEACLPFMERKD